MAHIVVKWEKIIPRCCGCYKEPCEDCEERCIDCCVVKRIAEFDTNSYLFEEDKDNFDYEYKGKFTSRKTGTIKPYYLKIDNEELITPDMAPVHLRETADK